MVNLKLVGLTLVTLFLFVILVSADLSIGGTKTSRVINLFSTKTVVAYGSAYNSSDGGWMIGIAATGVYYDVNISTDGELKGFKTWRNNPPGNGTRLQALNSGLYSVDAVMTGEYAGGEYGLGVVTNNADPETLGRCYTRSNINAEVPIGITCLKRLNAHDNVTLVIDDESTPVKDVKVHTVNLKLVKIDD